MLDYDRRGIEYMLDVWIRGSQRTKQTSVERALEENAKIAERSSRAMHLDFDRKHPPAPNETRIHHA